jgi:phage terminase small subunit
MATLNNARHEKFAQELAKGKAAAEAYTAAGYKYDRGNASRLTANDNISRRVEELQRSGPRGRW